MLSPIAIAKSYIADQEALKGPSSQDTGPRNESGGLGSRKWARLFANGGRPQIVSVSHLRHAYCGGGHSRSGSSTEPDPGFNKLFPWAGLFSGGRDEVKPRM